MEPQGKKQVEAWDCRQEVEAAWAGKWGFFVFAWRNQQICRLQLFPQFL